MTYKELAKGNVSNRGNAYPLEEIGKIVSQANGEAMFMSYYDFKEELKTHLEETHSIKDFKGIYSLSRIIFDIDKKDDSNEECLNRTRQFVERLKQDFELEEYYIQPWFSGTGYHVQTPDIFGFTPAQNLPSIVKRTLTHYFPEADDIYDGARIIRLGNTANEKSDLYKIPLTLHELANCSANSILELAKTKRKDFSVNDWSDYKPVLSKLIKVSPKSKAAKPLKPQLTGEITPYVSCGQIIFNNGPTKGRRHREVLTLASIWRRNGMTKEFTKDALFRWVKNTDFGYDEVDDIVNRTFGVPYVYGCDSPLMKEHCSDKCVYYKHKNFAMELEELSDCLVEWFESLNEDISNAIDLGKMWQLPYEWTLNPEEYIVLSGDTGLGKSALAQNVAIDCGLPTIYMNLEMGKRLTGRRFYQIKFGATEEKLISLINEKGITYVKDSISHIKIMNVPPYLDSIDQIIADNGAKLVVVDTSDLIHVKGLKLEYEKSVAIAKGLKEIAKKHNVIVLSIQHKNKSSTHEGENSLSSISQAIDSVQKADKVLFIMGEDGQTSRIIKSRKARDNEPLMVALNFNANTMRFNV